MVVAGMLSIYDRKIYTVLFNMIALFQTKKLELWKMQWILCCSLIVILGESGIIISNIAANNIFNFVGNAIITDVHTQTVTNGHDGT